MTAINSNIELLSLDVTLADRNFQMVCIYRPPRGSMLDFNDFLENHVLPFFASNEKVLLCGDININLFNPYGMTQVENYKNILLGKNFFPVIDKPTHFTPNNQTTKFSLIDHIWPNFICEPNMFSGTVDYSISDHVPIFVSWTLTQQDLEPKIKYRDTNCERNRISFFNEISKLRQSSFNDPDPCLSLKNFINKFYELYYTCFPIKRKSRKETLKKEWMTNEIKSLIDKKHRLLREVRKGQRSEKHVKNYCKILSSVIKLAKNSYQIRKYNGLKKSSRRMWSELNNSMGRHKKSGKIVLKQNDQVLSDQEAANHMNQYFTSIASKIAEKFPTNFAQSTICSTRFQNHCRFSAVTPDEVVRVVHSFRTKKRGMNSIQPVILQLVIHLIAPFISSIFNRCVTNGTYPDILKVARVVPLFKSGDSSSPSSYRPISTLCIFNKIFEKLIHSRLTRFIDANNILSCKQFGFRKQTSTTHAIFTLIAEIHRSFNVKSYTTCLFLDLKKAFDTVDGDLLMRKLEHYGVRGSINSLLQSYLTGRKQYVNISDICSPTLPVPLGVVQGSVLGPLLFNIFINDIVDLDVNCVLFADDAVFYIESASAAESINRMQQFIAKISQWLTENRLTANEDKTKVMIFSPCEIPSPLPSLIFNTTPLEWADEFKYLGIYIDRKLSFKRHIEMIINKLSIVQGITHSLRNQIPTDCLKMIFYALAFPHVNQSIIIWGGAPETTIKPIAIKMNKILRNVMKVRYDSTRRPLIPTNEVYKKLSVLYLNNVFELNLIKFIKSCKEDNNEIWNKFFKALEPSHHYGTRGNKLRLPNVRTEVEKRGTLFQCVRAWNNLPDSIELNVSIRTFKYNYKKYCLTNYL